MKKILLGIGVLTWNRKERITDRYGCVYLGDKNSMEDIVSEITCSTDVKALEKYEGKIGNLVAIPIETRESTHIGDLFRGIYPSTPEIGERIELGNGILFSQPNSYIENCQMIGLQPTDDRSNDWLNPEKLYRAHEQTVELYFETKEEIPD